MESGERNSNGLAALFRALGPLWFILIFGGLLAVIFAYGYAYARLGATIGWREDYGFTCRRRCLLVDMWHSRKLLEGGTGAELTMFAMIWFLPVVGTVTGLWISAKRSLGRRRERIGSMRE